MQACFGRLTSGYFLFHFIIRPYLCLSRHTSMPNHMPFWHWGAFYQQTSIFVDGSCHHILAVTTMLASSGKQFCASKLRCPPMSARTGHTGGRGKLSTRVLAPLRRTAANAWRTACHNCDKMGGGHPCLGSRPPFGPKHVQRGSCLDSEMASLWPPNPVGPEKQPCHLWCGTCHCSGHMQSFVQKHPLPGEAYYRGEAWCNIGSWRFYPSPPVHLSHHGGWRPIQWLMGHGYWLLVGCLKLSVSPLACSAHDYDHHFETA